jgi:hypothetical protein
MYKFALASLNQIEHGHKTSLRNFLFLEIEVQAQRPLYSLIKSSKEQLHIFILAQRAFRAHNCLINDALIYSLHAAERCEMKSASG